MKTKYKYIRFDYVIGDVWECHNNKTKHCLGEVAYSGVWSGRYRFNPCKECFVFVPESDCQFSPDCLADIINFMKQLEK